jgi:hypothetical protein
MGMVTFQGRHPFPLRHRKATRSQDSQEHGFDPPASLHIQSPTIGFIRSNIRGVRKMPVTPRIVAHATYLLKMGSRGGALSVTVGSCRCKQEHGTRTRYHFAIPLSGLWFDFEIDPKPDPRCRKDSLADWHYRRRVGSGLCFRVTGTTHAADRVVSHFLELVVGLVGWLVG